MRILDQPLFVNANEVGNKISQSWDWLKDVPKKIKSDFWGQEEKPMIRKDKKRIRFLQK